MLACYHEETKIEVIELLLSAGADIHAVSKVRILFFIYFMPEGGFELTVL